MGGLFSPPISPVQSNEAQLQANNSAIAQNNLLMTQMQGSQETHSKANEAQAETLREIELRDAQAEAERTERENRVKRGKRDLLFMDAMGVEDDEDGNMLLLGGG